MVLQAKGGVGKSFAASLIAQTLKENQRPLVCLDTDSLNSTFAGVTGLDAEVVAILDGDELDLATIDAMVERLLEEDSHFVVDVGASGFVPISTYLLTSGIQGLLSSAGKRLVIHSVIVGGASMADTASAIQDLGHQFDGAELVLWSNPFFGDVTAFEAGAWWEENKGRWTDVVHIPEPHKHTGEVVAAMLADRMTFAEARAGDEFRIVQKLRLANYWEPLRAQIEAVL